MKSITFILIFIAGTCYSQQSKQESTDIEIVYDSDSIHDHPVPLDPCFLISAQVVNDCKYEKFLKRNKSQILELNPSNEKRFVFVQFLVTKNGSSKEFKVVKNEYGPGAKKIALKAAKKLKFDPSFCKINNERYDQRLIYPVKLFIDI
ncbi:hypothetical protein [Ekhidna sp.]|uniref:hypothetical protein n=1 Tax=Ekhidna sp. TaxID=2608089 RepID=UPI003299E919